MFADRKTRDTGRYLHKKLVIANEKLGNAEFFIVLKTRQKVKYMLLLKHMLRNFFYSILVGLMEVVRNVLGKRKFLGKRK